ncbi:NAD(P)-binding protein [Candidatus Bathyarchaeota archaeon]|nr:NAD(P)-binding protein [Candidatus Bathyarchaeota archaeon]
MAQSATHPTSAAKLDVIVVGAGLSGLSTAIAISLSGHSVTVFESAKELQEVLTPSPPPARLSGHDHP